MDEAYEAEPGLEEQSDNNISANTPIKMYFIILAPFAKLLSH